MDDHIGELVCRFVFKRLARNQNYCQVGWLADWQYVHTAGCSVGASVRSVTLLGGLNVGQWKENKNSQLLNYVCFFSNIIDGFFSFYRNEKLIHNTYICSWNGSELVTCYKMMATATTTTDDDDGDDHDGLWNVKWCLSQFEFGTQCFSLWALVSIWFGGFVLSCSCWCCCFVFFILNN